MIPLEKGNPHREISDEVSNCSELLSVQECAARCLAEPDCVSFERQVVDEEGVEVVNGWCQMSSSCYVEIAGSGPALPRVVVWLRLRSSLDLRRHRCSWQPGLGVAVHHNRPLPEGHRTIPTRVQY